MASGLRPGEKNMHNRIVAQLGTLALLASLIAPLAAQTQTVEGNRYPDTVEAGGRTLTLVGAGLRERWWFDVYTMGAYAERRRCDPQMLIATDRAKSLRIDLLRDVAAKTMAGALEDAFERNLPPNVSLGLQSQIDTFLAYFRKDLKKGDRIELTYVPGVGTALIQNQEQQGWTLEGEGLADLLWSSYFSASTCCDGLKKQILAQCSQATRSPAPTGDQR